MSAQAAELRRQSLLHLLTRWDTERAELLAPLFAEHGIDVTDPEQLRALASVAVAVRFGVDAPRAWQALGVAS